MQIWEGPTSGEASARYWFLIESRDDEGARVRWREATDPAAETRLRTLDFAPAQIGPGAPDAACRDQTYDPFEDFVSFAFVRLDPEAKRASSWPGHPVRGDGRTCAAPDSCCAALTCGPVRDVEPNAAGCQLGRWLEERVAGAARPGLVRLHSTWSNGLDGELGASAERFVDFDAHSGRTLSARIEIHPRGASRVRHVQIVALDRCDGIQPLAKPEPRAAAWFDAQLAGSPAKPQP